MIVGFDSGVASILKGRLVKCAGNYGYKSVVASKGEFVRLQGDSKSININYIEKVLDDGCEKYELSDLNAMNKSTLIDIIVRLGGVENRRGGRKESRRGDDRR